MKTHLHYAHVVVEKSLGRLGIWTTAARLRWPRVAGVLRWDMVDENDAVDFVARQASGVEPDATWLSVELEHDERLVAWPCSAALYHAMRAVAPGAFVEPGVAFTRGLFVLDDLGDEENDQPGEHAHDVAGAGPLFARLGGVAFSQPYGERRVTAFRELLEDDERETIATLNGWRLEGRRYVVMAPAWGAYVESLAFRRKGGNVEALAVDPAGAAPAWEPCDLTTLAGIE